MNGHRFSTVLLFIAAAVAGWFSLPWLPLDFKSNHQTPWITISYTYPYASPEQIEQTITTPIEAGVVLLDGVDKITSEISVGYGLTRVETDGESSLRFMKFQLAQTIRQLYAGFPEGSGYPLITMNDPEQEEIDPSILSYSLNAPIPRSEIYRYGQEQLVPIFADLEGLERVEVEGSGRMEYRLVFRQDMLDRFGIRISDLEMFIRRHLRQTGLPGSVYRGQYLYLKLGDLDLSEILSKPFKLPKGGSVRMDQLVLIEKGEERKNRYYRVNGQESVQLNFVPKEHVNHLQLARDVRERLDNVEKLLPPGYNAYLEYDQTEYIRDELFKIRDRTMWSIGLLVLFVILAYRSFRDILILVTATFVNLGLAMILYHLTDVQLNLYGLAGITVSFGIILDNIIVMSHHYRHTGNKKVFPALFTATLTTLAALFVIFLLPETLKYELIDFAKVLSINLCVSLIVAYFFVPALVLTRQSTNGSGHIFLVAKRSWLYRLNLLYNGMIKGLRGYRIPGIILAVLLFGLPVFWLPNKIDGWTAYNRTIGSATYQENIKPLVNKILGGSLRLFTEHVYASSGFRSTDETVLYVTASLPLGSTIEQMNDLMVKIEDYLSEYGEYVKSYLTAVNSSQYGQVRIFFPADAPSHHPNILKSRLESLAINLGGVEWNIYGVGKGFSNRGGASPTQFRVLFKGYNADHLDGHMDKMAEILLEHPRISDVNTRANMNWWEKDRYEYVLSMDSEMMKYREVTWSDVREVLERHNQFPSVTARTRENDPIRLISDQIENNDLWALNNSLFQKDSLRFSFASMGDLSKHVVENSVHKEDQQYLRMLEFAYTGSPRFGQEYLDRCILAMKDILPLGYTVEQKRFNFWGDRTEGLYGLLGLLVMGLFFICSIHFESFRTPLIIITLVPLSFIGIFLTFYCFEFPFDQGGYASFLLTSGIVVNSVIIIFSDYHRLAKSHPGRKRIDLYLRAFRQKITPVYLTILSTALGLLPFTFHGRLEVFWFPLAVGTIGGLAFSLILIWVFVPLFIRGAGSVNTAS